MRRRDHASLPSRPTPASAAARRGFAALATPLPACTVVLVQRVPLPSGKLAPLHRFLCARVYPSPPYLMRSVPDATAQVAHFQLFRAARTRTGGAVIDGRNRYPACQELGANQATHGWPVREDAHHIGAASDLLVEAPALSPLIRGLQGRVLDISEPRKGVVRALDHVRGGERVESRRCPASLPSLRPRAQGPCRTRNPRPRVPSGPSPTAVDALGAVGAASFQPPP